MLIFYKLYHNNRDKVRRRVMACFESIKQNTKTLFGIVPMRKVKQLQALVQHGNTLT